MAGAFSTRNAETGTAPPKRAATYADLEAVPEPLVAEILDGVLVTHPRPSPRHAVAANSLGSELTRPFQKGKGGPGGWLFMIEPELHRGGHVVVPDLAAWRRERMPAMPEASHVDVAPDWVCEVLSKSTERSDRGRKRRIYADIGVSHLWLLDPRFQQLEAFSIADENGCWTESGRPTRSRLCRLSTPSHCRSPTSGPLIGRSDSKRARRLFSMEIVRCPST